jgi:pimeloyl-CoA synthetase
MSQHETHRMHANSLYAHRENIGEGTLAKRCQEIADTFARGGRMTDREVCEYLHKHDMNSVRPRITEMIAAWILRECGKRLDVHTNRGVRMCELVPRCEQLEMEMAI